MNKDDSGITPMDAATLEAVSAPTAGAAPPPTAPSDVVELVEHYETDHELAELAVALLNRAAAAPELPEAATVESQEFERYLNESSKASYARNTAALPSLLLISRALMRSAAAHERMATSNEHSRRDGAARQAVLDEIHRLQLENLRLQNQAFNGELARLSGIAEYAVAFAREVQAGYLAGGSSHGVDVASFAGHVLRLASGEPAAAVDD